MEYIAYIASDNMDKRAETIFPANLRQTAAYEF
jgi:hypothetical protein